MSVRQDNFKVARSASAIPSTSDTKTESIPSDIGRDRLCSAVELKKIHACHFPASHRLMAGVGSRRFSLSAR
jgi:hypothetical protein